MKRILFIATLPGFLNTFMINNFKILHELGFDIHAAVGKGHNSFNNKIPNYVKIHYISIQRSPLSIKNYSAYRELIRLIKTNNINIIDCHTPVGGVLGRLVSKRMKIKCIYTAHGFHFFTGSPLKNWLIFFPIEKWLSKYTDVMITINKEDYNRAKEKFHMKRLKYVPGVGIDTNRFQLNNFNKKEYRKKLGIKENDFMILSVGELNKNKNHEVIIKAIDKLNNHNIHYFIAGQGNNKDYLYRLINDLGVDKNVHLLGFRKDIPELCHCANIYAFPSKREGLGLAAIEGLAAGLPLLSSNVGGINDYSLNGKTGFLYNPLDYEGFAKGIKFFYENKNEAIKVGEFNVEVSKKFDVSNVDKIMNDIYSIYK